MRNLCFACCHSSGWSGSLLISGPLSVHQRVCGLSADAATLQEFDEWKDCLSPVYPDQQGIIVTKSVFTNMEKCMEINA
jgi:hypothetical protein